MDRIETMRSFVEVAKKGSFSKAARQLGLSPALVSRHILDLEQHLDIRLLNRTTRSVTLTEGGKRYFSFCNRIIEEIRVEDNALRRTREEPEGVLRVIAPMWFGSLDIGGIITDFVALHPHTPVSLILGGFGTRTFGFLDEGFDVEIHTREIPTSRLVARSLGAINRTLCASPAYLERAPKLETVDDLKHHACLVHTRDVPWRFKIGARTLQMKTSAALTSNSYLTLRTGALRGLGVAILPSGMIAENLASGRLVPVLPQHPLPARPLYVAYSPGGRLPAKVEVFVNYLVQRFRSITP